mgnify:CR=1 FL=1
MNPRELRIGNLVLFNGRIARVYNLSDTGATLECEGKTNTEINGIRRSRANKDEIKPIHISEEWFKKFGFSKGDKSKYYKEWIDCCFCICQIYGDYYIVPDNGKNYWETRIKYVHQLQNIYFILNEKELCEEERGLIRA